MTAEYRHRRKVEFSDTDMAGIMHFSRFFVFMESAEHAFFRSLGFSIHTTVDGKRYGWPRIHVECDYRKPLRFEDDVEIQLLVREIRERTILYDVIFHKMDDETSEEVARGKLHVICVTFEDREKGMKSAAIPPEIRSKLTEYPESDSKGE